VLNDTGCLQDTIEVPSQQMGNSQSRRIGITKHPVYQKLPLRRSVSLSMPEAAPSVSTAALQNHDCNSGTLSVLSCFCQNSSVRVVGMHVKSLSSLQPCCNALQCHKICCQSSGTSCACCAGLPQPATDVHDEPAPAVLSPDDSPQSSSPLQHLPRHPVQSARVQPAASGAAEHMAQLPAGSQDAPVATEDMQDVGAHMQAPTAIAGCAHDESADPSPPAPQRNARSRSLAPAQAPRSALARSVDTAAPASTRGRGSLAKHTPPVLAAAGAGAAKLPSAAGSGSRAGRGRLAQRPAAAKAEKPAPARASSAGKQNNTAMHAVLAKTEPGTTAARDTPSKRKTRTSARALSSPERSPPSPALKRLATDANLAGTAAANRQNETGAHLRLILCNDAEANNLGGVSCSGVCGMV
jgi:hypothetical protein